MLAAEGEGRSRRAGQRRLNLETVSTCVGRASSDMMTKPSTADGSITTAPWRTSAEDSSAPAAPPQADGLQEAEPRSDSPIAFHLRTVSSEDGSSFPEEAGSDGSTGRGPDVSHGSASRQGVQPGEPTGRDATSPLADYSLKHSAPQPLPGIAPSGGMPSLASSLTSVPSFHAADNPFE